MDGRKDVKSLGNLVFVSRLLKEWDARSIRLVLVRHHYRHSWEWDDGLLEDADQRLKAWTAVGEGDGSIEEVRAALDDDLDRRRR